MMPCAIWLYSSPMMVREYVMGRIPKHAEGARVAEYVRDTTYTDMAFTSVAGA